MKQSEVDSNRQAYWRRSGRLAICPLSVADVAHQNEVIEQVTLRATHSQSTPTPKITDGFCVLDIERKQCHMIFVHRGDYRSGFPPSIGKVVKFSKRCYAPCRAKKLRLATPAYIGTTRAYRRASWIPMKAELKGMPHPGRAIVFHMVASKSKRSSRPIVNLGCTALLISHLITHLGISKPNSRMNTTTMRRRRSKMSMLLRCGWGSTSRCGSLRTST